MPRPMFLQVCWAHFARAAASLPFCTAGNQRLSARNDGMTTTGRISLNAWTGVALHPIR